MIVNQYENLASVGLLLICVIDVLRRLQTNTLILKKEITPQMSLGKKTSRTINNSRRTKQKMTHVKNITCKKCNKKFERLEWMLNKDCENPNCTCPEVQKLRKITQEVIEKAQSTAAANVQSIRRNTPPTGYIEEVPQYMMDVPDVMVVDIIVPKTHFGRKRK